MAKNVASPSGNVALATGENVALTIDFVTSNRGVAGVLGSHAAKARGVAYVFTAIEMASTGYYFLYFPLRPGLVCISQYEAPNVDISAYNSPIVTITAFDAC